MNSTKRGFEPSIQIPSSPCCSCDDYTYFLRKENKLFVKVMAQNCVNTNDQNIVLFRKKN
jgi:hypothetical protein